MNFDEDKIQAVVKVLKSHFNNLTVEAALKMAFEILRAIAATEKKNET